MKMGAIDTVKMILERWKISFSKGIAIETVVYAVLAVVALAILWIFLSKVAPAIKGTVENIVKGMGCKLCGILGIAGWLMSGFCRAC